MVFNAGELSMIEYGVNEIIGSCRTEYMNPHQISVCLGENIGGTVKRIAFLADHYTIHVQDLKTGVSISTLQSDSKIDWLALSMKADKLLFRDRRHQLFIYDIETQKRTTLLVSI